MRNKWGENGFGDLKSSRSIPESSPHLCGIDRKCSCLPNPHKFLNIGRPKNRPPTLSNGTKKH
eukprot:4453547-Amphidinium_carterae.1